MSNLKNLKLLAGMGVGVSAGWALAQLVWVRLLLSGKDARRSLSGHRNEAEDGPFSGRTFEQVEEREAFTITHTVEDGIERIVYTPKERRFETPILMQHGMWHGAWCWWLWQELFAEWGWESHAFSLPGHSGSVTQRPIPLCTLDYYLGFLNAEAERLPRPPVLMGHSMGGALTQWYLRYVGDLPAAVLVAPWSARGDRADRADGIRRFLRIDPLMYPRFSLSWSATPLVRTPGLAAAALISKRAVVSPEELYRMLGPESVIVLLQHAPPYWEPADSVETPLLWLAGEEDAVIGVEVERRSAAHYGADFVVVEGAGHNLMMEHNYRRTAETIHNWLSEQRIG